MKSSTVLFSFLLLVLSAALHAAGNNWMTPLDGGMPLSRLSIPGTHDSGARFEPVPGTAKCQNLTIAEQLKAGVRFFDIRCRHLNDGFVIHHGPVYQKISFADVLNSVFAFLDANPGETVILSVKEEYEASGNTRSFEATFDSHVALHQGKWLLGSAIPTLGQARGKIVLFRRFGAASTPKGIDASHWPDNTSFSTGGNLRVQDRYVVSNNDRKWTAILDHLNETRTGGPDMLHLNFTSGYRGGLLGLPDITGVSGDINPRLAAQLKANPAGRTGILVMDFVDASLAELVYQRNGKPAASR